MVKTTCMVVLRHGFPTELTHSKQATVPGKYWNMEVIHPKSIRKQMSFSVIFTSTCCCKIWMRLFFSASLVVPTYRIVLALYICETATWWTLRLQMSLHLMILDHQQNSVECKIIIKKFVLILTMCQCFAATLTLLQMATGSLEMLWSYGLLEWGGPLMFPAYPYVFWD